MEWLEGSRQQGLPLFTPEVITATGGRLITFKETPEGFEAQVEDATRPLLQVLLPIGPEDSEYFPYLRWSGTIFVEFPVNYQEIGDPLPALVIDGEAIIVHSIPAPYYDALGGIIGRSSRGGSGTVYYDKPVHADSEIMAACHDNSFYPLDKKGWHIG